jgi:hypothetical protein
MLYNVVGVMQRDTKQGVPIEKSTKVLELKTKMSPRTSAAQVRGRMRGVEM